MAASNQQKVWKSFIWGAASLGLLIFLGIHDKVNIYPWLIGGTVYVGGFIFQVVEYKQDNETIAPDILMIIGTAIVGIMGAA